MKVIILAAGRGSRLGEITEAAPKALVQFRGKTLLEHNLSNLYKFFNKSDITIVGGYRAEMLTPFHGEIRINPDWENTNIAGSLLVCDDLLASEECIVIYSDIFYESAAIELLIKSTAPSILNIVNFLEIWERRSIQPLLDLETFVIENDQLVEIGGKPQSLEEIQGQFGGMIVLNPHTWRQITANIKNLSKIDTTTMLNACLALNIRFQIINYEGIWVEIDNADDLDTSS